MQKISETQQVCNECNSSNLCLDPESGEIVCTECGMVVSGTSVSMRPEWRAFDQIQREKLPRTGSPTTLIIHDQGLSTSIGWRNVDYAGRRLSPERRNKLYRLRKWNRRSKITNSFNRNLAQALSIMSNMAYEMNIPRYVIERSALIYRKALKSNLIRGRTIKSVVVATLYIACRQYDIIRSLKDVAKAARIPKKVAARNYRFLIKRLDIDVPRVKRTGYINRLVTRLELYGETEMLAMKLLEKASEQNFTQGRSPAGIAAACIYVSDKIMSGRLTQNQIATEAQITEVTIRNRYKELIHLLDLEVYV